MSTSFIRQVRQYLQSKGWNTESTQVREGTFIIRGLKKSPDRNKSIIMMAVTTPETEVTADHLRYLTKISRKKHADRSLLTLETGLRDVVKKRANEAEIYTVSPDTIRETVSNQPGRDTDQGSLLNSAEDSPKQHSVLTRRRGVASGGLLIVGLFSVGYYFRDLILSNTGGANSEAEAVAYSELLTDTDKYIGSQVYFSPAKITQVIDSDTDTHYFRIQTKQNGETWDNDLVGQWDGEMYAENELIEFEGIVKGTIEYTTELGTEKTIPHVEITEINRYNP